MMFVRLALESDREAVIEMGRLNCEETCAPDPYSPRRANELFSEYLATSSPTFYVVEERRKPVAFLMSRVCEYDHRDGFFLTQSVLFVRPERRGSRAAVLLMRHLLREADRLGAVEVHGGNDNSFRSERTAGFLTHFGFEKVGYEMRKRLDG